ncbi:DHH family phosphoesterase [Candidatus Saccharibacteria bacterium]|nr:DHH family phosphoesterase [Candidatus Saccharibacteria bacterium]MBI3337990.1 DHH family phosphoesterase [Candidatus Saccharibacteria bacterium]
MLPSEKPVFDSKIIGSKTPEFVLRGLYQGIKKLVDESERIAIIQADNPDGDSLGSALALEEILGDAGKQTFLYCGVNIPEYLRHLDGWDRVSKEIPNKIDLSIIVDTSAAILLEKLDNSSYKSIVASKPVIVLDHHTDVECDITYATLVINDHDAVATGEVIYKLADELNWPLNLQAKTHITSSILSDSLGLSSEGTTPNTYRIMADLIEGGVNRIKLEEARRAQAKMPKTIFKYKATLIDRTELLSDDRIALVSIGHDELMKYSPLYNPAPLIQTDMLQTEGVKVAIVLKVYNDGKITGSIRCNAGASIAADLASHFGGGGHVYASGFKVTDSRTAQAVKTECLTIATELLDKITDKS